MASADGSRERKAFTAIDRCPREQLPPLEQRGRVWSLARAMPSGARPQGSAERGATSLVGAAEVADGALSVGNQRQPLRSGCIYGKLSAVRGHQGHQLQHHDVKASGDCHDDVLIETAGGTVSESATLVTLGPTARGFNRKRLADTGVDGSSLA